MTTILRAVVIVALSGALVTLPLPAWLETWTLQTIVRLLTGA